MIQYISKLRTNLALRLFKKLWDNNYSFRTEVDKLDWENKKKNSLKEFCCVKEVGETTEEDDNCLIMLSRDNPYLKRFEAAIIDNIGGLSDKRLAYYRWFSSLKFYNDWKLYEARNKTSPYKQYQKQEDSYQEWFFDNLELLLKGWKLKIEDLPYEP